MANIRWKPWNIDKFLENDWDMPTIPGLSRLMGQGLNLYETEDQIVAEAAMPGVPEDRVDVTVEEGVVRVSASVEEKAEDKQKRSYFMSTMATSYNYLFRIPEGLKDKEPQCELEDGILTMRFDKEQKAPPRKIKVQKKSKEGAKK